MTCILFVGEDSILPLMSVDGNIRADMESAPTVLTTLLLVRFNKVVRNIRADMESAPTFGDNMVWLPLGGRF